MSALITRRRARRPLVGIVVDIVLVRPLEVIPRKLTVVSDYILTRLRLIRTTR
jgi:hypothetical protein